MCLRLPAAPFPPGGGAVLVPGVVVAGKSPVVAVALLLQGPLRAVGMAASMVLWVVRLVVLGLLVVVRLVVMRLVMLGLGIVWLLDVLLVVSSSLHGHHGVAHQQHREQRGAYP